MSFPRVPLPQFEPSEHGPDLAPPPALLAAERDAAYRVINALVRKYAGGRAFLETGLAEQEQPVIHLERHPAKDGFTIVPWPLT